MKNRRFLLDTQQEPAVENTDIDTGFHCHINPDEMVMGISYNPTSPFLFPTTSVYENILQQN
ncbi:hypothetical protein F0A16_06590 [Salinicola corii]|uniref:Uncharacterized protein n=1 Tax=Salinicola corii TaxID=2606937 RepID=A0A640WFI2_9GAMM|nr:hypothetical protein [Salinicola corii]KAA0019018.1 hypothetical protein F0A16_06590 [Salinicola corii]